MPNLCLLRALLLDQLAVEPYAHHIFLFSLLLFCYKVLCAHANEHNPIKLIAFVFGGSIITSLLCGGQVPVIFTNNFALPILALAYFLRESKLRIFPDWLLVLGSEYCRATICLLWIHKARAYFGSPNSSSVLPIIAISTMSGCFGSVLAEQNFKVLGTRLFKSLLFAVSAHVVLFAPSQEPHAGLAKLVFVCWMVLAPRV